MVQIIYYLQLYIGNEGFYFTNNCTVLDVFLDFKSSNNYNNGNITQNWVSLPHYRTMNCIDYFTQNIYSEIFTF